MPNVQSLDLYLDLKRHYESDHFPPWQKNWAQESNLLSWTQSSNALKGIFASVGNYRTTSKVLPLLSQLGCPQSGACKAAAKGPGVSRGSARSSGTSYTQTHSKPLEALGSTALWGPASKWYPKLKQYQSSYIQANKVLIFLMILPRIIKNLNHYRPILPPPLPLNMLNLLLSFSLLWGPARWCSR